VPTPDAAIARVALAPLLRAPEVRADQVSQLVLGETGMILESRGDWRRLRTAFDRYEGWAHRGYLLEVTGAEAAAWRRRANAWSDGAVVQGEGAVWRLPLRARVELSGAELRLPDGQAARILAGRITSVSAARAAARRLRSHEWATQLFAGTPYQWGGVTPWGVDCSGLVQTVFAARGMALPRDAADQAGCGRAVDPGRLQPDDLLFFRAEDGSRVSHVALAGAGDTLVHAALSCGGFVVEPWVLGTRAAYLRDRLVAVRRIEEIE
jgi:hypothetical protein